MKYALAFALAAVPVAASSQTLSNRLPATPSISVEMRRTGGGCAKLSIDVESSNDAGIRYAVETESGDASKLSISSMREGGITRVLGRYACPGGLSNWLHGNKASFRIGLHVPRAENVNANTDNGDIVVRAVTGRLSLSTQNGNITASAAGQHVSAQSSNGDVRVAVAGGAPQPDVTLATSNGDVELRVPASFSAHVSARTSNGSVRNPFADAAGPGHVELSSSNGDVGVVVER